MIVLILVAVLWLAVLVPTVLSKLSERRSAGSIGRFHERLDLLERTGPKLVQPAYRLTGTESGARSVPLVVPVSPPPVRPTLTLVSDADPSMEREDDDETGGPMVEEEITRLHLTWSDDQWPASDHEVALEPRRTGRVAKDQRRTARQRRRDVFGLLCALTAVTGLIGLARPLRGAWVAAAIFFALLVGFVALAAYAQHLEAERRHLNRLGRHEATESEAAAVSQTVRYLSEEELDLYYEGHYLDDDETDERMVAEG